MESDSPLTDEQQEVYDILKKKQEINAIAVKERSADENKKLKQYLYELTKIKSNIIEDLLNKFPEFRKQTKTKTGAQRVSALRSRQDEQKKNEERQKDRLYKCQVRSTDTGEPTEKRKRQAESVADLEDIETGNGLNNERDDNKEYNDTQVMESDSVLTEEEKKSMQSLRKKKIFFLKQ